MYNKKINKITKEPDEKRIYIILFNEYVNKLKNLEQEYIKASNLGLKDVKIEIINKLKNNLKYLNILFEEEKSLPYINIKIPIILPDNNVGEKNQLEIFLDELQIFWVKYNLINLWKNNGGIISSSDIDKIYLDKYEQVLFFNELEQEFKNMNKDIIKKYKNKFYNLLTDNEKKKLNTFLIYLLLKNDSKNLSFEDLKKITDYYADGINLNLLDELNTTKLFFLINKYLEEKKNSDINEIDVNIYTQLVENNNNISVSEKNYKINEYKKKYLINQLNAILFSKEYLNYPDKFIELVNDLKNLNYEFNSKQKKNIELLKLNLDENKNLFDFNFWYPLFTHKTLNLLKEKILCDFDKLCYGVKKMFSSYKISTDFFCLNHNKITNDLVYSKQEDIYRTINLYCAIIILVGIINQRLIKTFQDYQIIVKGGKAFQMILSDIGFKNHKFINYESNDIDLIINPINPDDYNQTRCKNLTKNIINLIKWIFNANNNMYNSINYVSTTEGLEYKTLFKLSHKIQESNDLYHESAYTAIADFDYEKMNNLFYSNSNLILDEKELDEFSEFGKLIYFHQNFDDYLMEKIFYFDYYTKELNKLHGLAKKTKEENKNLNNYLRFIEKITNQLKQIVKVKEMMLMEKYDTTTIDSNIIYNLQKYLIELANKKNLKIKMKHIFKLIINK